MGSSLIMGEDHNQDRDDLDLVSSSSSDVSSDSSSSDLTEDATSPSSSSSDHHQVLATGGPLDEMSSLMQQLPFKRGLSKFFQGKSQSFTSLSNVRCSEDLAKPENPYKKRLKSCKSYGGLLMSEETHNKAASPTPQAVTRAIAKKSSRGSCSASSLSAKGFLGNNRPPIPPQKPSALCNQTPLFV